MANAVRVMPTSTIPKPVLDELAWRVAQGTVDLPLLPNVALEVTRVAAHESSDARAIAELLRRDQAMAAHVLRVVSSPVYGGLARITSLQQAVARLGVRKIREIALAIAFRVGVFKLKGYETEVAAMFQHSVSAAFFAQEIAQTTGRNVEDAFLCGLLHDIGRPVILQALVQILNEQRLQAPPTGVVAATGDVHAELGGTLAESWGLPDSVEAAIRYHHSPDPPDAHLVSVRITALADQLSHHAFDPQRTPEDELRRHQSLEPLEIYPERLDRLLAKTPLIRNIASALT